MPQGIRSCALIGLALVFLATDATGYVWAVISTKDVLARTQCIFTGSHTSVTIEEDSRESAPPLKRRVEPHAASAQDSSAPFPS
jgi:hypothetical protein